MALALAQRWGAEILSVDSMQVYRGMDVGTAKPSPDEQSAVRHHLIDVVDPSEEFTAARFVEMADDVIRSAARPLIAVGGTPLYYKTLFEGLFEGPGADFALRARLEAEPLETLYERLKQVDPEATTRIHLNDRKRIVRALEVFELTGKPITQHQREWGVQTRHRATWVGLNWEKETLNRRINARVKGMMQQGWLEECERLLSGESAAGRAGLGPPPLEGGAGGGVRRLSGSTLECSGAQSACPPPDLPLKGGGVEARPATRLSRTAGEATGYFELFEHLRGRMSLDDAVEQIKIATRQLARKQMKWFRRFENTTWIAGESPLEEQVRAVEAKLLESGAGHG